VQFSTTGSVILCFCAWLA